MDKDIVTILLIEETSKDTNLKELILAKKETIEINLIKTTSLLEAKKIISEQKIDVILSYIDLSDAKNLEIIDIIHDQSPQLPVILLTDIEDLSLQRKLIQKNVQDCLSINYLDSYNLLRSIYHAIERNKNINIKNLLSDDNITRSILKPDILSALSSKEENTPIKLLDLVDLKDLQRIQDSFAETNDVASMIIDLEGNAITKPSNFCDVCKLVRQTEKGQLNCSKSDKKIGERALEKMEPHFESCHSCGFIDASAPIIVEGKTVAHWLVGQSNVLGVDNDRIIAYAEEIGADKDEMLKAYSKMTNMPLDRFKKITELLWLFAQEISNKGYNNLKLAQELKKIRETELFLNNTVDNLKISEKNLQEKQNELIESQALLNSILDQAPTGVLVINATDGSFTISNRATAEITSYPVEKWSEVNANKIDIDFKTLYLDKTEYKDNDLPIMRAYLKQETIKNEEVCLKFIDGSEKYILINATPVYDNNDKLIAATAVFADITERKKLEKELLSQNKDLQAKGEELISQNEELQAKEEELISQNEELQAKEEELIFQNAELQDKQNELIESQALLNSILDQAPVGVLASRAPDMRLYITNKAANEITGLITDKWTPLTLNNIDLHYENFYPDRTPYKLENLPLPRAMRDEEVIKDEEIILKLSDGSEKWVLVNASPVYDTNNNLIAATAVFSDITIRKKLQEELINYKNNLEKIVEDRTNELNTSLDQLKTINLRLELANKHKNQFISSMSHELRTPLNAIIGFTQSLEKQYFGDLNEKQMEYIRLVKNSGDHLLSLINDILNIAKIDSGSIDFVPEDIKVEKCIREIVLIMSSQFKDKKINLNYFINDDVDLFYSDERKCKQILFNLLSNALKFTKEGGNVNIEAFKDGDFINICVIDDGIGIKEKDIDRVFEEFYQSDITRDQALGGAGIGLALTERLVRMHGGTIELQSKPDQGSKFSFTIPVKSN